MKHLALTIIVAAVIASSICVSASSISYRLVNGAGIKAHAITIDLANPGVKVSVALARGGRGSSETFQSIVKRTRPVVAITGTFFDTKTLIPTGDIALFGSLVHSGCLGSALCISSDNVATIVPYKTGRLCRWSGYETVLCAGPTLLSQSQVTCNLPSEGFRRSLYHSAKRTAVGITSKGKIILLAVNRPTSLYNIAKVMLKLDCTDALCLDGGSSTGFFFNGHFIAKPTRKLTNLLVVYGNVNSYQNHRLALVPRKLWENTQKKAQYVQYAQLTSTSQFGRPTNSNPAVPTPW